MSSERYVSVIIGVRKAVLKACIEQIKIFAGEVVVPYLVQYVNKGVVFLAKNFFQFNHHRHMLLQHNAVEKENGRIIVLQKSPLIVFHYGLKLVQIADK